MKCKICDKECTELSMKIHVKKQHGMTYRQYRISIGEIEPRICICGESIEHLHHNSKTCNTKECRELLRVNKRNEKFKGIDDIPICKICGMKSKNLTWHLNKLHNISVPEYIEKYNLTKHDVYHESYLLSIGVSGEKNPAYNHGGKYSPFSKKFIYHDESKRQDVIKRASENRSYNNRLDYYLERTNGDINLAKKMLKDRQSTFSLGKCIKKYGDIEGRKIWKSRQDKWLSNFKRQSFSKVSQEVFWILYENIKNDFNDIYFAQLDINKMIDESGKNHEYKLDTKSSYIKPDFLIKDVNKIIEFDGDYWHGPKRGNQQRDKERDNMIIEIGYKVLHIKECDWKYNRQEVIKECLEFIYGTTK